MDCKNEEILAQRPLTCGECFTMMEYLADLLPAANNDIDVQEFSQAVQDHLSCCPDCNDYYLRRLRILEAFVQER
jgi:hypothetical protein